MEMYWFLSMVSMTLVSMIVPASMLMRVWNAGGSLTIGEALVATERSS